ncbi:MAG TPA: hypothetical protein VFQ80_01500, partial [Thermomicrobiales bacterium]|nr:hypothetical protein [Thermomicrobiales bacterium]
DVFIWLGSGERRPCRGSPYRCRIIVTDLDAPTVGIARHATPALLGFMRGPHAIGRAVIVPVAKTGA